MNMIRTTVNHNGVTRNIGDFSFDGITVKGYIQGKLVEGKNIANYTYTGYKRKNNKVSDISNAKHYLVDLHDMMYGNAPVPAKERPRLGTKRIRVRNTHIIKLGDGRCIATGEISGVTVAIEYDGFAENNYTGELKDSKPWLRDVRKDLEYKYDYEFNRRVDNMAGKLKVLRNEDVLIFDAAIKAITPVA